MSTSILEKSVRADERADILVRDAMLLSLVLGAIPGEIRKMQSRADECAEAIESLIARLGDICDKEVSDTATQYYQLVQRNRECGQLLSQLSESINAQVEALALQQQVASKISGRQSGTQRSRPSTSTTKTQRQ
jgi:hypothetical protein